MSKAGKNKKIQNFLSIFYLSMTTNAEDKIDKEICIFSSFERKIHQRQVH